MNCLEVWTELTVACMRRAIRGENRTQHADRIPALRMCASSACVVRLGGDGATTWRCYGIWLLSCRVPGYCCLTIRQLAKEIGLSPTTVSLVLIHLPWQSTSRRGPRSECERQRVGLAHSSSSTTILCRKHVDVSQEDQVDGDSRRLLAGHLVLSQFTKPV